MAIKESKSRSKIDEYGLGARVLKMRDVLTCEEIADEVNRLYLPAGAEPLNKMTVSRYCAAHGKTDMERNDISKSVTRFDVLAESWAVRNRILRHTNKIGKILDELKSDEEKYSEISSISNAYNACLKFQQDLNVQISKIQKEQLGLEKVRKILTVMLDVLAKYPQVKAEMYERFLNEDLMDTIRSV